ncbi:hypothetical protein SAMD00019534_093570 [Acytostelium subglobosum LB1]|uniref:hypothetical protein n=1 Tax=Acytostelium subglobosum LB1 TaxID=1410327 RepID=UPI000644BA0A|nr:hypothetical protein SAMD00019534_093570 [Acytostelium subglobosum LB1]GAM26182.1 hypothetical protein SAMD00019534_093570 [Acytostelium subglobosum LB1]|eukprot:XP_012750736.1 hypothetical protein SAMD00019534_093570 [Acytostelium subglobosum LB1]
MNRNEAAVLVDGNQEDENDDGLARLNQVDEYIEEEEDDDDIMHNNRSPPLLNDGSGSSGGIDSGRHHDDELNKAKNVRRHIIGAVCVLIVVFLWVFSSIMTQIIFTTESFDKPFFLTYFSTSIFSFYLFGFVFRWKQWSSIPIQNDQTRPSFSKLDQLSYNGEAVEIDNNNSSPNVPLSPSSINGERRPLQMQPHSIKSIIKFSAILCPIWFAANYTYNISLDITSISSNTILSSLSGVFSLFISVAMKVDKFTIEKLFATIISLTGIIMVSYSDISGNNGNDTVIGDLLAVVGAFLYGLYCTMIKKLVISENLLPMPMLFGFIGLINFLVLWPGFFILNSIGFEVFAWPSGRVFLFLLFNGIFGSFLSDLIESYSVVLTSPVINTIGLSLSIPLAMISDFVRKHKMFGWMYLFGSALVILGFLLANLASSLFESRLRSIEQKVLSKLKGIVKSD